jgi:hypothetical protein
MDFIVEKVLVPICLLSLVFALAALVWGGYEAIVAPTPTSASLPLYQWNCVKTETYMVGKTPVTDCVVYARNW